MLTLSQSLVGHKVVVAAAAVLIALLFRLVVKAIINERKITALGGRAPLHKSRLPFGLGLAYHLVKYGQACDDRGFWEDHVIANAHPERPWTVETTILGQRTILTVDEDNIKALLATQFNDFGKGADFYRDWHEFLGDGIFNTDGKQWQESRHLIRPQFVKDRVADLNIFEEHVQAMLPLLKSNHPINLSSLLYRFTLDAATHFLLGRSADSLHDPQSRVFDAFSRVQNVQALIARAGPAAFLIPRKERDASLRIVNDWVQPVIDRVLDMTPAELDAKTKSDSDYTFLHALAGYTRDRTMIRDQIINVLLAGRDTTAGTLSWLFLNLSHNPTAYARLRAEILSTLGPDRTPPVLELKGMKYLQSCISETLRLHPTVPNNLRMSLVDTTFPRGGGPDGSQPIGIPAGTRIGYSTLVLQNRADIYPPTSSSFPDHNVFSPERWEDWHPTPWTYIPFNGGPRICIGQQFALTQMAYFVTRVLQRFETLEDRTVGEVKMACEVIGHPNRDLMMVFGHAGEHAQ